MIIGSGNLRAFKENVTLSLRFLQGFLHCMRTWLHGIEELIMKSKACDSRIRDKIIAQRFVVV